MINIIKHQSQRIEQDSLSEWLSAYLEKDLPGKFIYIIPQPNIHLTGESKFYAEIDVDELITKTELLKREVREHSRGDYIHFYVDDVVSAACAEKELTGSCFTILYEW